MTKLTTKPCGKSGPHPAHSWNLYNGTTLLETTTCPGRETTYTVDVTPLGFDGLIPLYEISVYAMRPAGICGPVNNATVRGMEGMHGKLDEWGFKITGEFGPICANGFASAPVTMKGTT